MEKEEAKTVTTHEELVIQTFLSNKLTGQGNFCHVNTVVIIEVCPTTFAV